MGKVTKIRPKRHDAIVEALQMVLDFGDHFDLDQHTRDGLANAVGRLAPPERWGFVMLNPDQQRAVLTAIKDCPRPAATVMAWNACISFIAYDRDGEVMASRYQIAEAAGLTPENTSRALTQLVEIGALIRLKPGRYRINPHVGWSGPLHKRELAGKEARPVAGGSMLAVVDGGKP